MSNTNFNYSGELQTTRLIQFLTCPEIPILNIHTYRNYAPNYLTFFPDVSDRRQFYLSRVGYSLIKDKVNGYGGQIIRLTNFVIMSLK
jgi:hypothetical protein